MRIFCFSLDLSKIFGDVGLTHSPLPFQTVKSDLTIVRIDINTNPFAVIEIGCNKGCSTTEEWIENGIFHVAEKSDTSSG